MDGDKIEVYQCCFCSKPIASNNIDPCEIDTLINIDKSKHQQYNQVFYCHLICFKNQLHEKIRFYLALECLVSSSADTQETNE